MTTLVTGAGGHIGGNLVRALLAQGRAVRALVHRDRAALEGLASVECVEGDVCDPAAMADACRGVEVVFHLAARISITGDPRGEVARTNVDGVGCVARAAVAAGVRRFVHFSSVHAYDLEHGDAISETSPRAPAGAPAYNRSKWAGEQQLRDVIAAGLDAVIVNPVGVIGPVDFKPSRMGRVFLGLVSGRFPSLVAGGFCWVDVRDVVAGALAAEVSGRTGENYLVAGHWASFAELASMAADATGARVPRRVAPMWLARIGAPFVEMAGKTRGREPLYTRESLEALRSVRVVRCDKARDELGFEARPLSASVHDTYAWFRENGHLNDTLLPCVPLG